MSIQYIPLQRSKSDVTNCSEYGPPEVLPDRQELPQAFDELLPLSKDKRGIDTVTKGLVKRGYHFLKLDEATIKDLSRSNERFAEQRADELESITDAVTQYSEYRGISALIKALVERFPSPPPSLVCHTWEQPTPSLTEANNEGFHVDRSIISAVVKLHGQGGTEVVAPSSRKAFVKPKSRRKNILCAVITCIFGACLFKTDRVRKPGASVQVVQTPDDHMVVMFGGRADALGQKGTIHRAPPVAEDSMFRDVSLTLVNSRPLRDG